MRDMNTKIFELLNDIEIDLSEYEDQELSMEEKKRDRKNISRLIKMKNQKIIIKPMLKIAVFAILILTVSTSVYAIGRYFLSPKEVVESFDGEYATIGKLFERQGTIPINYSVSSDEYKFTLLGITTGDRLWELFDSDGKEYDKAQSYIVLAIERLNGEMYISDDLFWTLPLIKGRGLDRPFHAIFGTGKVIDGILYQVVSCDELEIFADRGVYLLIYSDSRDSLYLEDSLLFDSETGAISLNPNCDKFQVLMELPLDKSKADPKKAEERLKEADKK